MTLNQISSNTAAAGDTSPPEPTGRSAGSWSGHRTARIAGRTVVIILLSAVALLAIFPFLWLLRSSFMSDGQIFKVPPEWIPAPVVWTNFSGAFEAQPFLRYLLNTLSIIVIVVPGVLISCSAAAFAFARLQWPGRNIVFGLLMTGLMLPYAVTLIPTFVGWQILGAVDTYWPLVLPPWLAAGGAFYIFMLRQFFLTVPIDLDNAVYVDGGSPFTVYRKVILPLNKGPLTLVAVFTTIGAWNDFLNPLIYLSSSDKFTLLLGLSSFQSEYSSDWGPLMAATLVVILPMIVLFAFAQRYIVEGVALTGLKG
jgi:multiple sugar transport system permease protein